MKTLLAIAALVVCASAAGDAQTPALVTKVTYFDQATVAAALAKGATLVSAPDMIVSGSHRDAGGQVEVHDKQIDVLYITDGSATFVTGGTLTGGRVSGPGQQLGTGITGGETRKLVKGDVIIVPAGIPHWFKDVSSVSYFVVKVVKP